MYIYIYIHIYIYIYVYLYFLYMFTCLYISQISLEKGAMKNQKNTGVWPWLLFLSHEPKGDFLR